MFKNEERLNKIRHRRNFFATLIVTFAFWLTLGLMVYFSDPQTPGILILFYTLFFLAMFFTATIILTNRRRGLLTASSLTLFLLLRYFGLGSILNFILITGIAVAAEFYLKKH